jgi:hypothetical protein
MQLELSTSPRTTWVWAPNAKDAEKLRSVLVAAGRSVSNAIGRNAEPRVLDLDIGVDAMECLEVLQKAGYSFCWHPTQHELNRQPHLYGVAVSEQ